MTTQRRAHPRVDIHLSAEILASTGNFTAITRNLSVGGAALDCERPLVEGSEVRLSLFLVVEGIEDERTPPLLVGATVQWAVESDEGGHTAGVRFTDLTPAQAEWLARFLKLVEQQAS